MTASKIKIHVQYLLLPVSALSSMFATSYHIMNTGLGPKFRFSSDSVFFGNKLSDLGIRVLKITKNNRAVGYLDASGYFAYCQPLSTQRTFLYNPDHPSRILLVFFFRLDKRLAFVILSPGSLQLKLRAPNGQAAMQNLQPIQRCMSCITTPSFRLKVALVGHTLTHAGLAQWLQKRKKFFSFNSMFWYTSSGAVGKVRSKLSFQIHLTSCLILKFSGRPLMSGTLWMLWQASMHFW